MDPPPPVSIHLTSHRDATWMLFPAAGIGLLGAAAWLSTRIDRGGNLPAADGWGIALAGVGGLGALVLLIWVITVTVERAIERRQIFRVFDQAIACWPQFATEKQWRQVITAADNRVASISDIAWPMGIVTVVLGAIAVGAGLQGMWSVLVVLAAFWVLVFGLVAGRTLAQERHRRADRRRREKVLPYPSCWLAAEALYHEDWGLVTLDKLGQVRLVPPAEVPQIRKHLRGEARKGDLTVDLDPFDLRLARSGWSLLQFTLDEAVVRTVWHRLHALIRSRVRLPDLVSVVHVRVPPGHETEAGHVVTAVTRRWLADETPDQPTTMARDNP